LEGISDLIWKKDSLAQFADRPGQKVLAAINHHTALDRLFIEINWQ
jgi:hypothetical protein